MTTQRRLQSVYALETPVRPLKTNVLDIWVFLSFGACALLPILLATSARPTALAKSVQAGIFVTIFATALPVLLMYAKNYTGRVLLVYGAMVLFSVPIVTQRYFYLEWVIGDILLLSVPALLGIALSAAAKRRPSVPRTALRFTVVTLMIAAVVASFFPDAADSNRYAAPAPLLMAAVWLFLFSNRGGKRFLALVAVGFVGVLTWGSQWRSSVMVFVFIGIVMVIFLLRGLARVLFPLVVVIACILAIGLGVNVVPGSESGPQSNNRLLVTFRDDGSLGSDSSTVFRLVEANAVADTVNDEWMPANYLFGGGHGATYNMDYLDALPGSARFEERNGRDRRVHNIHLGAVLLAYRYGLLGLVVVLYMSVWATSKLIAAGRRGLAESERIVTSLAFVGCLLLHMANNVTTNIHFTLTAALLIAFSARPSMQAVESDLSLR